MPPTKLRREDEDAYVLREVVARLRDGEHSACDSNVSGSRRTERQQVRLREGRTERARTSVVLRPDEAHAGARPGAASRVKVSSAPLFTRARPCRGLTTSCQRAIE